MHEVNLITMPRLAPSEGRIHMTVGYGLTISEMVAAALPGISPEHKQWVRVLIGGHAIDRLQWHRIRPKPGVTVLIRVIPGTDTLRSVLSIAVAVAALAFGQFYLAPMLVPTLGTLGANIAGAVATAGLTIAGNLLINALVPVRQPGDRDKDSPTYGITGMRNVANPDGVVPWIAGKHRVAPPYAALPYTEAINDERYIRAIFVFGYGPLEITDLKIGDTPIEKYKEVEFELREGLPGDTPLTLYPDQVIEEALSVSLISTDEPTTRYSPSDVTALSIDITFASGLIGFNDDGDSFPVGIRFSIRYRLVGTPDWTVYAEALTLYGEQTKPAVRTIKWDVATRGRYEVEVLRVSPEAESAQVMDRSDWTALRGYRPEYPIAFDRPLAVAAVKIRGTGQLNGMLDNFNALCSSVCLDYDSGTDTWIERETQNPASLFRYALQGPMTAMPKDDEEIDLGLLEDWHAWCVTKGLKYNRVHDSDGSLWDALSDIAAAGRASPHDRGDKWAVVIDRPQDTVIGHVTPRNSWNFNGTTAYTDFPDAFRVKFLDETNDFEEAERIVPHPGFVGTPELTEELSLPGITDPAIIWKEARKRWYELIHRPHTYTAQQDVEALVHTRGDLAIISHDVIDRTHGFARVKSVSGTLVTLDDVVTMEAGGSYVLRTRDAAGDSIQRTVTTIEGETDTLILTGAGTAPAVDQVALFASTVRQTLEAIVVGVEAGEDLTARLTFVDHAPQIDSLTAAEVPPAWDGRVGEVITVTELTPPVPSITSVAKGLAGDDLGDILVTLLAGSGNPTGSFEVRHRLSGAGTWEGPETAPVGSGAIALEGYADGNTVEIQARARSPGGSLVSAYTASTLFLVTSDTGAILREDGFRILREDGSRLLRG
jgi:hypothetical protein